MAVPDGSANDRECPMSREIHGRITRRQLVAGTVSLGASLGQSATSFAVGDEGRAHQVPGAHARSGDVAAIAIADVTVVDATGSPPLPHMTVTIEGKRIADIRPADTAEAPAGVHAVDGAGRFLIPGLWDAHVHTFVFPWQPEVYLPLLVANGVTGLRDMGGAFPMDAIDEVGAAIGVSERVGPRIVAGKMVDGPTPVWPFALRAGTAAEGRQAVAAIAEAGADFAKVYTLLPREAFFAIADAANEANLPFAGHVPITVTAAEASEAGQRTIEHYTDSMLPYCSTDEEALLAELRAAASGPEPVQTYAATFFAALPRMLETFDPGKAAVLAGRFAANQTWFTPTLVIGRNAALAGDPALLADSRLRHLPPQVVASWQPQADADQAASPGVDPAIARRSLEVGAEITLAMQRAGAPVLAGTDLGLPYVLPGFSLHDELALLVDAGLEPLAAIQAATRDAAHAVGCDDLGTIEPGKLADLVLLNADPLADIANTTRIAAVVANGRLFDEPDLAGLLQTAGVTATPVATPLP
jgi:hypothetical protein